MTISLTAYKRILIEHLNSEIFENAIITDKLENLSYRKKLVYAKRALKLAEKLKNTVVKNNFNYQSWIAGNWNGEKELSCGTTACAAGHACLMPEFRRLGLRLSLNMWYNLTKDRQSKGAFDDVIIEIHKNGYIQAYGHAALQHVFGPLAEYFFVPEQYYVFDESEATPQMVAFKIETLVKKFYLSRKHSK